MFALLLRLILSPLSFHSDLNNNAIWGIYAREFGLRGFYDWLNFGNYARPDYPPLAMILFSAVRWVWELLFSIFWKINITIGLFPSKFIPWLETSGYLLLLKLPGIFADIGIGYLIYVFIKEKHGQIKAKIASSLFLFNIPVIYLSASWGQLDSVVTFFGLMAAIALLNKKYFSGLTNFFVSLMIKVTMAAATPILVIQSIKNKISVKKIFILSVIFVTYLFVIGQLYIDKEPIVWTVVTYWKKFVPGAVTLPYINLNAFNFWGLIFGLERLGDTTIYWRIPLSMWAWFITTPFFVIIFYKFWKGRGIFFSLLMTYFAAFMFLPRVHERYLYPIFVFFPLILIKFPRLIKIFIILSVIFFINLYHWWWMPRIEFLAILFDFEIVERGLCFMNLAIFGYLFNIYLRKT
ncbi:hypothetical protein KKH23_02100 [Patescibacteria group bacterium]|nr:hypothetical protein [Patescibacteria group bacterium]MBU0845974.1 hypothetical protein [Patescibacteria group bacterium]MBU1066545.1 hypothetical protein [Patescibacteria group bacterium]MBU1844849.1 hypothetical protein [Patescibacteria group bacterium]